MSRKYRQIQSNFSTSTVMMSCFLIVMMAIGVQVARADTELTVLHCWDGHRTEWVDEMFALFEEAHPGVKVTGQLTACGSVLQEQFIVRAIGGIAPDVTMIHSLNIPGTVELEMLVALDPYLERDQISNDTWYPSEVDTARWKGHLYGLPMRTGGDTNSLLYYNKDVFAESGIGDVPTTWDEWLEVARLVTRYDGDQLVRGGSSFYGGDYSEPAWLVSGDGLIFSDDATKILFQQDVAVEAVTFMRDAGNVIYRNGWQDLHEMYARLDGGSGSQRQAFATGALAMQFNGALEYSFIMDNYPDTEFGIGIRPTKSPNGPTGVNAGTFHWAMSRDTADPDVTWELVKWLSLVEESAGRFMLRQGRPSPVRAFNNNPVYFETNPDWLIVGEALSRSVSLPMLPYTAEVVTLLVNAIGGAVMGDYDPGVALTEAAAQAQGVVDAYWAGE